MKFQQKDKIVLIGDSITDTGRREDPEEIGYGYVRLVRDHFVVNNPTMDLKFINKGIGGDRVTDLEARWEEDVISLQPDWVSVSIGINDVWRQLDHPEMEQVYPERYEQIFTKMLTDLRNKTNAKIILMEPTIIEEDVNAKGNQLLIPYVEEIHRLAKQFDAIVVPTHEVFINFLKVNSGVILTTDGVHMNSYGNMLMAKTWIETLSE